MKAAVLVNKLRVAGRLPALGRHQVTENRAHSTMKHVRDRSHGNTWLPGPQCNSAQQHAEAQRKCWAQSQTWKVEQQLLSRQPGRGSSMSRPQQQQCVSILGILVFGLQTGPYQGAPGAGPPRPGPPCCCSCSGGRAAAAGITAAASGRLAAAPPPPPAAPVGAHCAAACCCCGGCCCCCCGCRGCACCCHCQPCGTAEPGCCLHQQEMGPTERDLIESQVLGGSRCRACTNPQHVRHCASSCASADAFNATHMAGLRTTVRAPPAWAAAAAAAGAAPGL